MLGLKLSINFANSIDLPICRIRPRQFVVMLTDEALSTNGEQEELLSLKNTIEEQESLKCMHHGQIEACIASIINERTIERVNEACRLLDYYLEQPYLLDPYLSQWIPKLCRLIIDGKDETILVGCCRIVYSFCKVRGAKSILPYFEHEVSDFLPILTIAGQSFNEHGPDGWQVSYVAFLMTAVAFLLPFSLDRLAKAPQHKALLQQVILQVKGKLMLSGSERRAAVIFMCNLLRRGDDGGAKLEGLTNEAIELLKSENYLSALGLLECISSLAKTTTFLPPTQIFSLMDALDGQISCNSSLIRKTRLKLYSHLVIHGYCHDVDRCLNAQLHSLDDAETLVRLTAAKGIASIAKILAPDSIADLINVLFKRMDETLADPFPSGDLCNGIALTLAKLSQVGLLPDTLISKVMNIAIRLSSFEAPRGKFLGGSAVRDAACYIIWATVRCYPSSDEPFLKSSLANTLVCCALFDREASCRRAAAAAFQELVGRWGGIPHGIELLGKINFFDTHHLRLTFGFIAREITLMFPVYTPAIVEHLLDRSISSWDRQIRQLAAPLLAQLSMTHGIPIFDRLIAFSSSSDDISTQHGSILTLSHFKFHQSDMNAVLPIALLLQRLPAKMLGWELIAGAVFCLITTLCKCGFRLGDGEGDTVMLSWLNFVQQALQSRDDSLHQIVALETLPAIYSLLPPGSSILSHFFCDVVLTSADKDRNVNAQRGFTLAIGAFPKWFLIKQFTPLMNLLNKFIRSGAVIEKRVNAIRAVGNLLSLSLSLELDTLQIEAKKVVVETLLWALDDYTIDSRGDIGSIVRLATMETYPVVMTNDEPVYRSKLIRHIFDKLDKLRKSALLLLKSHGSYQWPWDILEERCYKPELFFPTLKEISLSGLDLKEALVGIISSAGSINMMIAKPALELLQDWLITGKIDNNLFVQVLGNCSHGRLQRSVLLLLDRISQLDAIVDDAEGPLYQMVIKTVENPRANMHNILVAVSILIKLGSSKSNVKQAKEWLINKGCHHEYARVRELCSNFLMGT